MQVGEVFESGGCKENCAYEKIVLSATVCFASYFYEDLGKYIGESNELGLRSLLGG